MVVDTLRGKISDLTSTSSDTTPTGVYIHSAILGFVGGLRSMTPLAALSLLRPGVGARFIAPTCVRHDQVPDTRGRDKSGPYGYSIRKD